MEFLGDLDVPWWGFPVGIGLIVLGLWTMWKAVPFTGKSRDWITTQATVVKVRQKKNREGDGYDKLVRYRFLDQAGNEHQGSEQRFLWGKRGDTFRVNMTRWILTSISPFVSTGSCLAWGPTWWEPVSCSCCSRRSS
jgi:hypothetical protein